MMAAIWAAGSGASVTVLEKAEKPLKKLYRTGNGRCNLTNLTVEKDSYRGSDPGRRDRILAAFPPEEVLRFFRKIGLETKSRNGWMYPLNDSAASVVKLLLYEAERLGVKVKTNQVVVDVIRSDDGSFTVKTADWQYAADAVVVSVGTSAGGSETDPSFIERLAGSFGLSFRPFLPALTALHMRNAAKLHWSGVRCEGRLCLRAENREAVLAQGELQLTEKGISGIPAFQISRYAAEALAQGKNVSLEMDFMPRYTEAELADILTGIRTETPEKPLKLALCGLLPEKLAELFCVQFSDAPSRIPEALKKYTLDVCGTGAAETAQVCMGGISLVSLTDELESANAPGLFFTGEAVDVDGACGGYNLQWAWSSGRAAGICSAKKQRDCNGAEYA